jgi:hypothetical protein
MKNSQPRSRLPQVHSALPVCVNERSPLGDEAAVRLEHAEDVENLLHSTDGSKFELHWKKSYGSAKNSFLRD